jgi:hypothetical protein
MGKLIGFNSSGMKLPSQLTRLAEVPKVTNLRIGLALGVAVVADGIEICTGFFGWVGFDQVIDLITMIVISRIIGFHPLMLPTFVIELVPLVADLPTWVACVVAVGAIRKREQRPKT